jgi:uncharacterized protein
VSWDGSSSVNCGSGSQWLPASDVLRLDLQGHWFFPHDPIRGQFPAGYEPSPPGICVLHCGGPFDAHLLVPLVRPAGAAG